MYHWCNTLLHVWHMCMCRIHLVTGTCSTPVSLPAMLHLPFFIVKTTFPSPTFQMALLTTCKARVLIYCNFYIMYMNLHSLINYIARDRIVRVFIIGVNEVTSNQIFIVGTVPGTTMVGVCRHKVVPVPSSEFSFFFF